MARLAKEEQDRIQFDFDARERKGNDVEGLGFSDLPEGATFGIKGEEVKLVELDHDPDTGELLTVLLNSKKYGDIRLDGQDVIRIDKGTLNVPEGGEAGFAYKGRSRRQQGPINLDTATDEELADFLRKRFGEPLGARPGDLAYGGRGAKFNFSSYDKFKEFMDQRFAASDLESMKGAYAEADTPWKVRYLKETRKEKPGTIHSGVIEHIATGSPLPAGFTPAAPAPPPPPPPGTGTPPVYPQPPPPPPREPTRYPRYNFTHLVQLLKMFDRVPTVNKRLHHLGRFLEGPNTVELKRRLLWDQELAERVLGHEIGHFIDLALDVRGADASFAQHWLPLRDFRQAINDRRDLNAAAKSLSTQWRGPFLPTDRYRNRSTELFADVMSAMFNAPEWVNRNFPLLHDTFSEMRASKPAFDWAYRDINTFLFSGSMPDELLRQSTEAVKASPEAVMEDRRRSRQSFLDYIKQATVSIWHRVYGIEGKPRAMGEKKISELERSHVWADKENSLFFDEWLKKVKPDLEQIDPEPLKQRAYLHAFLTAERVIYERRASGKWIEDNPDPARLLLEELVTRFPALSPWLHEVRTVAPTGLYDLGARIFREIHDKGDVFVNQAARAIDSLNLGVHGNEVLAAYDVRGKLLNPYGLTPETGRAVLNRLQSRMTPEQWRATQNAARAYRGMIFDVMEKAHAEGLISDKSFKELVEPNRNTYVPFAVLDYWNGHVGAGILPQKGTAKPIADVLISGQLKVASMNVWRQSQRQVRLLQEAYHNGGVNVVPGEMLRRATDIEAIKRRQLHDDISRAVYWVDGKPRVMEFPNDRGKSLEQALANPEFYEHIQPFLALSKLVHGFMSLFTTWNPVFMGLRNPPRDVRTSMMRLGVRAGIKELGNMGKDRQIALNYAHAAFGAEMSPEVRDLVEKEVLPPPRLASTMVSDANHLGALLQNGSIMAYQARRLAGAKHASEMTRQMGGLLERQFMAYEAYAKIYAYNAAKQKGLSESESQAVARVAGIPNPGVMGKWSIPMEVFFPWLRVHIQGIRADLDTMRDPNLNRGFATRVLMFEVLPRVMKVAIGAGLVDGAIKVMKGGGEDTDSVLAEALRRVSPYKMALDDIIPLAFYDPRNGTYHFFWEFPHGKDVPKHFEVVSQRIASSEQGKLWGTMIYQMLSGMPGAKEKLSRPGYGLKENMWSWLRDYAMVGPNPMFETGLNVGLMSMAGKNPEDSFTGKPAANKELFKGEELVNVNPFPTKYGPYVSPTLGPRGEAIAGYTLQRFGFAGEMAALAAVNLGLLDERTINTLQRKMDGEKASIISKLPVIKSMLSYDNYARYRDEQNADIMEQHLRDKAHLVMSRDVEQLFRTFTLNNGRIHEEDIQTKKITQGDWERFLIARDWSREIWGTTTNRLAQPGSIAEQRANEFYSKALHAVTEGSPQAKATVRRDLDQASEPYVLRFKQIQ